MSVTDSFGNGSQREVRLTLFILLMFFYLAFCPLGILHFKYSKKNFNVRSVTSHKEIINSSSVSPVFVYILLCNFLASPLPELIHLHSQPRVA